MTRSRDNYLENRRGWRGDEPKERIVQNFLHPLTGRNREATLKLFDLLKNQQGY